MALSAELGKAGFTPSAINTTATITMEKTDAGFYRDGIPFGHDGQRPALTRPNSSRSPMAPKRVVDFATFDRQGIA